MGYKGCLTSSKSFSLVVHTNRASPHGGALGWSSPGAGLSPGVRERLAAMSAADDTAPVATPETIAALQSGEVRRGARLRLLENTQYKVLTFLMLLHSSCRARWARLWPVSPRLRCKSTCMSSASRLSRCLPPPLPSVLPFPTRSLLAPRLCIFCQCRARCSHGLWTSARALT